MRPILSLTLFVCALLFVPGAAAQQSAAKPERRSDAPAQFADARTCETGGLKGSAISSSADKLDESLENLHFAIQAFLEAHNKWEVKVAAKTDVSVSPWIRFGVDPFKFTFKPEFSNTITSTFYQPALALGETEFKPAFTAVYELSLKDLLPKNKEEEKEAEKHSYLKFFTIGVSGGLNTPDPFRVSQGLAHLGKDLQNTFSIYAKIEVPLTDLPKGSKYKQEEASKKEDEAKTDLLRKQSQTIQRLDQAIQQIREGLRQKQN
jgi:hypothetical protein